MSLPALKNYELTTTVEKHFNSPQVRNVKEVDLFAILTALLTKAFQFHGYSKDEHDFQFIVNEIYKHVKKYLLGFTINEVIKVFENGLNGVYGEYYGINTKTIITWFNLYKETERKRNLIDLNKTKDKPTITEEEKIKTNKQAVTNALNYFLDNKKVDTTRLYVYLILWDLGYMIKDKGYINKTKQKAEEVLKKEWQSKQAQTLQEKRDIKKVLDNLEDSPKINLKCREIALKDFFTELSKDPIKLDNFIKTFK